MRTNQINKLKLLITGAFVAFTSLVSAQSAPYAFFTSNSSTSVTICAGDSALMTAVSFNSASNTFKWFYHQSGQSAVQVSTTASWYASKVGDYEVKEYDVSGNYVGNLYLYPSYESNTISLTSTSTSRSQIVSQGSSLNSNQYPTINSTKAADADYASSPFGYYTADKAISQILITKSELEALGFTTGSVLEALAFEISQKGDYANGDSFIRAFKIKMGGTTAANLDNWYTGAMTTVFDDYYFYDTEYNAGWSDFTFGTDYTWNGTDNICLLYTSPSPRD